MGDFKVIEKTVNERKIIEQENRRGRHYLVYQLAGNWNQPKKGVIKITYGDNSFEFKSSNVAKRLDSILRDLMNGTTRIKSVATILEGRQGFTLKELDELQIEILLNV